MNAPDGEVASGKILLPPGWLIAGGRAFPGTFGSFSWSFPVGGGLTSAIHADAIPPRHMRWLATATAAAGDEPVLIFAAPAAEAIIAQVSPWGAEFHYDAAMPIVPRAKVERDGPFVVLKLPPLTNVGDQLLSADVDYGGGNEVTYFWRLNPAR